jgi:SsrA-binding protein
MAAGVKIIAQNKKAYHEYYVLEKSEVGIELFGTEVKSVRGANVNLKDSYCFFSGGELFVRGMHISPYEKGNIFNKDPVRERKLLMHKRELLKLRARVMQEGIALIPLSVYLKGALVKVEVGVCRGKKLPDKRDAAAQKDAKRDIDRAMKENARR